MPYATDYTTLLTGSYWSGAEITAKPVFVTYSFDTTAPPADAANLSASAYATFTPYTAAQQAQARQALAEWSSASTVAGGGSGVTFLEVPSGKGDINFAAYDFSSDPNASGSGGMGYYPWGNWNYSTFGSGSGHFAADLAGPGDILMNTAFETGGLFAYATVLHEIGHALGLKHPTDAWTDNVPGWINVPHNQWDPNVGYNSSFSIMSAGATALTDLTAADYQAIQSIYGTPAMAANEDKSWSWNAAKATLTQTLKDDGETVRGVSTSNTINGGAGNDTVYAIGSGANTVNGKGGNDTLVGGSGTSHLDGGAGADVLNGWFGTSFATYKDAPTGVTVNLLNPSLNTGDAAGDSYLHLYRVEGSTHADTLTADNNADYLYGLAGNDSLIGGSGADHLFGGAGTDVLTGGTGKDFFAFTALTDSTLAAPDLITDFATGDKIALNTLDADTGTAGNQAFHLGGGGGHAGDLVVSAYDAVHNRTIVDLYVDNNASIDAEIWLTGDHHTLAAKDFML